MQSAEVKTNAVLAEQNIEVDMESLKLFSVLPPEEDIPEKKAMLGQKLYFERKLSKNQSISCNNCHELRAYGVDNMPVSLGYAGQKGPRNAPSVYNASLHFKQFWDGRAESVEEQATKPILNAKEMGNEEKALIERLSADQHYVQDFKTVFGADKPSISLKHIGEAIGAYERTLRTPSRWDRFLAGETQALSNDEKRGLQVFMQAGCQACHHGALMGGDSFQKLGQVEPWPDSHDLGRYQVSHQESDKMVFKVPSLRNVEKTAPYFHDGSVATLEEAIRLMGKHQLGKSLKPEEIQAIKTFLEALTGELPAEYKITAPESLKEGETKPKQPEASSSAP
jgi:cytochrome c peroxidase